MKPYFEALKAYIEKHPLNCGDADSVLGMLYECHNENNPYDNEQIKADFNELYQQMNGMPLREMDKMNMSPRLYTPGRARCTPSSPETEQRRRRGCTLTLPDLHGIIDVSKCWEE